jgi:hypothetical protein
MEGACTMYGRQETSIQDFGRETSEESGVDGRIILITIFRKWDGYGLDLFGSG